MEMEWFLILYNSFRWITNKMDLRTPLFCYIAIVLSYKMHVLSSLSCYISAAPLFIFTTPWKYICKKLHCSVHQPFIQTWIFPGSLPWRLVKLMCIWCKLQWSDMPNGKASGLGVTIRNSNASFITAISGVV